MSSMGALLLARANYEAAAKALQAATQRTFPIGTFVDVTLGRSRVHGKVTGHSSSWWYETDYVYIDNVETGKPRKFCATLDCHEVERVKG